MNQMTYLEKEKNRDAKVREHRTQAERRRQKSKDERKAWRETWKSE